MTVTAVEPNVYDEDDDDVDSFSALTLLVGSFDP